MGAEVVAVVCELWDARFAMAVLSGEVGTLDDMSDDGEPDKQQRLWMGSLTSGQ